MSDTVYALEVILTAGRGCLYSTSKEDRVARTIEMLGSHDLDDLHWAISSAFERDGSDHLYDYEFPASPEHRRDKARPQIRPFRGDQRTTEPPAELIGELGLEVKDRFWYCYDFGDDWMHKIILRAIGPAQAGVEYPRVIASEGQSPPQYDDWDEDEEWDEDEDEAGDDDEEPAEQ